MPEQQALIRTSGPRLGSAGEAPADGEPNWPGSFELGLAALIRSQARVGSTTEVMTPLRKQDDFTVRAAASVVNAFF